MRVGRDDLAALRYIPEQPALTKVFKPPEVGMAQEIDQLHAQTVDRLLHVIKIAVSGDALPTFMCTGLSWQHAARRSVPPGGLQAT